MNSLIINKGAISEEATEAIKMDPDEWNIGGGYNAMRIIEKFQGLHQFSCETNFLVG